MKKILSFVFIIIPICVYCQKEEIKPFVEYIQTHNTDPVDYVMDLFEKYDIVILGERDHRDMTQYELIKKIVTDPRFIANVGNVFMEVGVVNKEQELNEVLQAKYPSKAKFQKRLRELYRYLDFYILWEKTNYWDFLNFVYDLNSTLPCGSNVNIGPTDVAFDWKDVNTPEEYQKFEKNILWGAFTRDSIMGLNFISLYDKLPARSDGKAHKVLAIYNSPHSYYPIKITRWGGTLHSTASLIFSNFPGKVANVLLNTALTSNQGYEGLIAQGKWDAAFKYLGNPNVGFDLEDSPFGNTPFNRESSVPGTTYKDVFSGFIFYKPVESWLMSGGIPGLFDRESTPELARRLYITEGEEPSKEYLKEMRDHYCNKVKEFDAFHGNEKFTKEKVDSVTNYWLK